MEETRIALVGIIVENPESVERINRVLHEYSSYIIGRMGLPHRERGISIISIVVDAPGGIISALSGKLGMPADLIQGMTYLFVRACVHYALFEDEDYLKLQLDAIRTSLKLFAKERKPKEEKT